jgi:RND family efflux transporter MFP subunit
MLPPSSPRNEQQDLLHSEQFSTKAIVPNKVLLAIISFVSFALLVILMVFSGNQSALALDESKLLFNQQAKVEVSTIEMQSGYIKPRLVFGKMESLKQSDIGFELSGTLTQLKVTEGAIVSQGQVLATLDVARLEARQNELKSSLDSAKANATLAKLSAQRISQLVENNIEPQQRLDEVQAQLNAASAAVNEARARIESLNVELAKSSLSAPFSGQIVRQYLDEGTVVSPGQALFSILAKESLEARFGLPEQTAFGLRIGESRELVIAGQSFQAQVSSVAKQRNQATRTIDALFSVDVKQLSEQQKAFMVSGDLVSLSVDIPVQTKGAWVPLSALASGVRGLWTLYVVNANSTIEPRLVSVEYANQNYAFVSGAINNGDKLVVSGIHRLVPQQSVNNVVDVSKQFVQNFSSQEQ